LKLTLNSLTTIFRFLALGGAIGTGLFIGSGAILSTVGPAPLFMAYLAMMLIVWNVMNCLAEMVVYLPLKGITIPYFVNRFLDDSLAFAAGWNYWYAYAILVAAEASVGAVIISYWDPNTSAGVWITVFLILVLALNIIAVSFFGEVSTPTSPSDPPTNLPRPSSGSPPSNSSPSSG
jgi:amino acid transporter